MSLYQLTNNDISAIEGTTFAALGIKERGDLQRLLRRNVQVISSEIGVELLVIAEEFSRWETAKRRIDLLAVDKDANLVVLELKRDEDGGHMELQALRYAAMVATLTFKEAVDEYQRFLEKDGSKDDAQSSLLKFLGWSEPIDKDFGQDVHIILVSADFSQEITSTVLWLNDRNLVIRCVRLKPHQLENKIVLDVEQLIPLQEAGDYIPQLRRKKQEELKSEKQRKDPPVLMRWADEPGHDITVTYWKDVLVQATTKALKLGLSTSALPMHHETSDDGSFNAPRQVLPDLVIETNASAETIRDWLSKMLLGINKPKGFLQVLTSSEKTYDLPTNA